MKTIFGDQAEFLGGAERFLLDFFQNLSPAETRRIDPVIWGGESEKYRKILHQNTEIPVEIFDFPPLGKTFPARILGAFKLLLAARRLARKWKKCPAPVVLSNTPRTHLTFWVAKIFFGFGPKKWVVFVHDFTLRPRWLQRRVAAAADILVANSMPTRNFLRDQIRPRDLPKIRIVENGICFENLTKIQPVKNIKNILIIGRIDPRKGQKYFLGAAKILAKKFPNLRFRVVGSPVKNEPKTQQYFRELQSFLTQNPDLPVEMQLEVDDPFGQIAAADAVCVLPTEPETFGRVVIESLALGRVVVSFDETGPREILKSFESFCGAPSGLFRCEKSEIAIAEKIEMAVKNPQIFCQYAQQSPHWVRKNYDFAQTKRSLLQILTEKV